MNETIRPRPLRERFFRRERRSVPAARKLAYEFLADWGLADTERGDDVLLCVSELATNALVHGVPPGRQFLLFLRYDGKVLRVAVHDSGPGEPFIAERAEHADESADEGGRGLLLVAALSDKWGVGERDLGKVVWCEWELPVEETRLPSPSPSPSPSLSR
ncbi:ATP-binding protein [Streptomyces sp. SID12501]|uniref:ATP-binding protein n=1 Tax=Streptomyces sp. SID12501 TaxID=2706042 RepID=A0A6B3BPQ2_9ACTN|nr:ATP-binding protein [Streptomyces sp. SID12501]